MTDPGLASPVTTPVMAATLAVCPYLMSSDGRWRASTPAREHRCTVITPPAILAPQKQRRLCLKAEHLGCSTYLAALATTNESAEDATPDPNHGDDRRHGRPVTRTAPLVLDHGRLAIGIPALRIERVAGQSGLVGLMGVAFAAIVIARLSSGGPNLSPAHAADGASASPSAAASPGPTVSTASSDVPTRTLVPTEVEPTPAPPKASAAAPAKTYKVRNGDTLGGIAREFGTTVRVLQDLNGIDNPRLLRVGQVLELP